MLCKIVIIRYPKYFGWAGVFSMALFHVPLMFNKQISFYKLMGSGKDGSFSKTPDWRQWSILIVSKEEYFFKGFIIKYFKLFNCQIKSFLLEPFFSKGVWDKQECFGKLDNKNYEYKGSIAVLTRATIRLSQLNQFWKHVPIVNEKIKNSIGLIESYGIGEIPFIKQATLSIWENEEAMKAFAYKQSEHKDVIVKTRKQDWYSEEMFTRFKVLKIEKM